MKKRLVCYSAGVSLGIFCLASTIVFSLVKNYQSVRGELPTQTLTLDSNQKIVTGSTPTSSELTGYVSTANNNTIALASSNIINNESGWQTILPGGYVYNPFTNAANHNQISGMTSVKYVGNGSLELHYGYASSTDEILYSFEHTLTAGIEYAIEDANPSYFYIKNSGESNINISSLQIKYSCVAESYPLNNLKVLMIGNSFADDTVFYAARIANSLGINLQIYDAYIAGCTLDTHYSNIQSGETAYSMRSMNGSSWNYQNNMSLSSIISYDTWDVITLQQASAQIGRTGTYSNLTNLMNEVKSLASGNPKYYWHQTWAYDQDYSEYYDYFSYFNNDSDTMFEAIVDRYHDYVEPSNLFEKTIYNGTAVQNMRTSYMKNTFSRDGKHMSLVHGRYLLASNFISVVFGIDFDLSPVSYRPDGLNQAYLPLVNEAIRNARRYPDVITNSAYTVTEMGNYDLSNYTEIDAGLVGCSFWNCTDSSNYNKRINHTSGTSNIYVTSNRFTQSTLPIGSLVFCQEGLGFRPEAWVSDAKQSSRKSEQYDNVLEIDSSFWSGYQYRAFNIFKSGKQSLSGEYVDEQYDDIFNGFRIFVPNSQMGGLNPKTYNSYYNSDKTLFTSNSKNINNFERVHLDPITGFYKCDSYYYLMNSYVDDTAQRFVCTRPFVTAESDLPAGTVLIIDSGYQWRSDCWTEKATTTRPNNVSTNFTVLDSSFMSPYRRRTFNISKTDGYTKVGQNSIDFMNHFRIYVPKA